MKLQKKIIRTIVFSMYIFMLCSCWNDKEKIKLESQGLYVSEKTYQELFDKKYCGHIILSINPNGSYTIEPKINYIDRKGKWSLFKEGLVRYVILENEDGKTDRLSTCCSDDNKVTLYYYLNKEKKPERIIFNKVK